jgi:hypothetical protein
MSIDELKAKVEKCREHLKANSGNRLLMSEAGPPSMGLIDALVEVVESQQRRIEEIERQLASSKH